MYIVAIIIGMLLLAFGGGCVLLFAVLSIGDPKNMLNDIPLVLTMVVPLGVLPAVLGWFLFRWGVRRDRERRAADVIQSPADQGEAS